MLGYGFEVIGLTRIVALVNPNNAGSKRVVEKLGMRFEKVNRVDDPHFSGYDNEEFSAMTDTEYFARYRPTVWND